MCDLVIDLGKQGASKAEMALNLGVSRQCFDEWEKLHGEFGDAVKEAVQFSQGWWEQRGREATFKSKDFSAVSYIFQMKNRFRHDWSDRVINEHVGKDDGAIEITTQAELDDARKVAFMLGRAVSRQSVKTHEPASD